MIGAGISDKELGADAAGTTERPEVLNGTWRIAPCIAFKYICIERSEQGKLKHENQERKIQIV